jgi:hypothetical protein
MMVGLACRVIDRVWITVSSDSGTWVVRTASRFDVLATKT